jgi:hypothetical protein
LPLYRQGWRSTERQGDNQQVQKHPRVHGSRLRLSPPSR